jgi:hypothetical protein
MRPSVPRLKVLVSSQFVAVICANVIFVIYAAYREVALLRWGGVTGCKYVTNPSLSAN